MNMFLVYMAGNSISIFPIMMIGMIIIRSVKALFTVQQGELITSSQKRYDFNILPVSNFAYRSLQHSK